MRRRVTTAELARRRAEMDAWHEARMAEGFIAGRRRPKSWERVHLLARRAMSEWDKLSPAQRAAYHRATRGAPKPMSDDTDRYEVTIRSGPPGHADSDTYRFKTLKEARHCYRTECDVPHFRWAKIVDLTTGEQLIDPD